MYCHPEKINDILSKDCEIYKKLLQVDEPVKLVTQTSIKPKYTKMLNVQLNDIKMVAPNEYNYPFVTEGDLRNYLDYSGIEDKILNSVINGDNTLFPEIYLPINNTGHEKIYNDSIKIFQDRGKYIEGNSRKAFLCKKQFWDYITTFVNSEKIFNDKNLDKIVRFQYLINTTLGRITEKYTQMQKIAETDVLFMYKGGTTMKIVYGEYSSLLNQFPRFKKKVSEYFKRSDSDYTFLINPNLDPNTFNKIYYHFAKIELLALQHFKKLLIENEKFFVDINSVVDDDLVNVISEMNAILNKSKDEYNNAADKDLLTVDCSNLLTIDKIIGITITDDRTKFIEDIPDNFISTDVLKNDDDEIENNGEMRRNFMANKKVTPKRKDFIVTKKDIENEDSGVHVSGVNYEGQLVSNFYISSNETVHYIGTSGTVVSFLLSRMKYNFIVYYKTTDGKYGYFNCPSEIIDISCSKRVSHDIVSFYESIEQQTNIYKYKYQRNTPDELVVKFIGLSIYGFAKDFIKILIFEQDLIWQADKYEKRIYRLLAFCYFELSFRKLSNEIPYIAEYFETSGHNTPENNLKHNRVYQRLRENIGDTAVFSFIRNFEAPGVRQKFINNELNGGNLDKYNELVKILSDTFSEFAKYSCPHIDRSIDNRDGAVLIEQMGGYYKKYLKYVRKNSLIFGE